MCEASIFKPEEYGQPFTYHDLRTLRILQTALAHDNKVRLANLERIQELHAAHADEVTVFCAHDPSEFEQLA
jgi:hypothetical protein